MKIIVKIAILTLFAVILNTRTLVSQDYEISIANVSTRSDTVDMGMCYFRDSLQTKFLISNTGTNAVYFGTTLPWQLFGASKADNNGTGIQHLYFQRRNIGPTTLEPNSEPIENDLQFLGASVAQTQEAGRKTARFLLAPGNNQKREEIVYSREFFIISRNSQNFIDGYDDINFDSVYIKTPVASVKTWKLKNLMPAKMSVDSENFELVSSKITADEIVKLTQLDFPLELEPKATPTEIEFSYKPLNRGLDSAIYMLEYKPLQNTKPESDSIGYVVAEIRGVGVEQKIDLISAGEFGFSFDNIAGYTVDLGNLIAGEKANLKLIFRNTGNINVGIISQKIEGSGVDYEFIDVLDSEKHFLINEYDSIEVNITPNEFGRLNISYLLETNFHQRKIFGVLPIDRFVKVNITGNILQPRLSIQPLEVDFGSVSGRAECLSSVERNLRLSNIGTTLLRINSITIIDDPNLSFNYNIEKLELNPGEQTLIKLNFTPPLPGEYSAKLRIVTNVSSLGDTNYVEINGIGLPAQKIEFEIEVNKVAAGSLIKIPIRTNGELVRIANKLTANLTFDRTVLQLQDYEVAGTALDGISPSSKIELDENNIFNINFNRIGNVRFNASDTLIILNFKGYVGNSPSTDLVFSQIKFGDDNCPDLFETDISRTTITIDSVCGIENKAYQWNGQQFNLSTANPMPVTNSLNFDFINAVGGLVLMEIFNSYGEKIDVIKNEYLSKGTYHFKHQVFSIPNGAYFLVVSAGIYKNTLPFIIER